LALSGIVAPWLARAAGFADRRTVRCGDRFSFAETSQSIGPGPNG